MADATGTTKGNINNHRVTNALLKASIDNLAEKVAEWHDEQKRCNDDHEERIRDLERRQTQSETRWQVTGGSSIGGLLVAAAAFLKAFFDS